MDSDDSAAIELRDATIDDATDIASIYNETVAAGDATMDEVAKTGADFRAALAGLHSGEAVLVMRGRDANGDATTLGWGIVKRYSDRAGYRFACETAAYLRRSERRRGLGTRLKRALIERSRELGYHHLVAKIMADNEASLQYNLRLGYEVVGRQREIGFRAGRWVDVLILELILDDVAPTEPMGSR